MSLITEIIVLFFFTFFLNKIIFRLILHCLLFKIFVLNIYSLFVSIYFNFGIGFGFNFGFDFDFCFCFGFDFDLDFFLIKISVLVLFPF